MYLLVAATSFEMESVRRFFVNEADVDYLVCGVGLVESTFSLSRFLAAARKNIQAVILFGIAGAYIDSEAGMLDLCLAEKEILADLGISMNDEIIFFDRQKMNVEVEFSLPGGILIHAEKILADGGFVGKKGTFVTVNCASGTLKRGMYLKEKHQALCENMEGAAVVRVCQGFQVPCVELRCVSNMVMDRDPSQWLLREACEKSGAAAACLVKGLLM